MNTGQPNGHETAATALVLPAADVAADSPAAAGSVGAGGAEAADSPPTQGTLSHPLSTVQTMNTGQPNGHETATAALPPPATGAAADTPAAGCKGSGGPAAAANTPPARGTLSHPLSTVQTMETRQPNGHKTAATALLPPTVAAAAADSAAGRVDAGGFAAATDSPPTGGTLSHPLSTVQTMETRQPNGHETATTALLPPTAGASADAPAAGGGGVGVPGVVFVGTSDVSGRVAVLVDALVSELGGLPAVGAGRDLLRSQVAALGRLRAAADAAEARVVAAVDGLGDGGVDAVEVLRRGTGSSQREAQRRKRRADALAGMPNVAGALAAGDISTEHAEALARAAEATSAGAVDGDAGLLAEVARVPADRAGRRIQEWTQRHQDPDDLHEQHLRQRRRRRLSFGDGDDGMLVANAAFDRVQGAQFRSLINGIADRIWRSEGGRNNPHNTSAAQRRLDALAIAVGLQPPPPPTTAATGHRPRNQPAAPPAAAAPLTGPTKPTTGTPEPLSGPTEPRSGTQLQHRRGEPVARTSQHPQTARTANAASGSPDNGPAPPTTTATQPDAAPTAGPTEPSGGTQPQHRRGEPAARTSQHPQTARTADAASAASGSPDNGPAPPTTTATQPDAAPTAGPTEPSGGTQLEYGRGEPATRASQNPQTDRTATNGNAVRDENAAGAASTAGDNPDDGPAASGTRDDNHRPTGPNPRPPTPERQADAPGRPPTTQNRQAVPPQLEPPTPDRQPVSPRSEPAAELSAPPATPDRQFESPRHQIVIVASADVVSGQDPHGRCEIPGIGPIPQSELERLACDAELFGLLFSGKGEPLWHGRAKRTVTDTQRRTLIARDGGCVLCAEEPARCEAHHITPWAKPGNGPTDIDNLALLCGTCHRRLHNNKRVLTRNPDGAWATAPDPRHHHHTSSARPGPATLDSGHA